MVQEKYTEKSRQINLSVTNGEITSVIRKSITKSACRVYENGCIGVAGKLGEADGELMNQAAENLKLGIPYEAEATAGKKRKEHYECGSFSVEDNDRFLKEAEEVLGILKKEYPQIIFGNKIRLAESGTELVNDAGTELVCSDRYLSMELLVKHVDSVNIMDDALVYVSRDFERDRFLREAREHLDAFLNQVPLPEGGELPLIVNPLQFGGFLIEHLDAQSFGDGTSFFNGKLGEKVFDDGFSFYVDRGKDNLNTAFFDVEGSTCAEDRCDLIRNGVLLRPYADKKLEKEFGYENTATAAGAYDSVPSNGDMCFAVEPSDRTLRELIGAGDGIYVTFMSGGDFTGEGDFASPVQTAFLYRDGRLVGRLPEFGVSGNIYDIFGKNFVGLSSDRPYEGGRRLVVKMKLQRD